MHLYEGLAQANRYVGFTLACTQPPHRSAREDYSPVSLKNIGVSPAVHRKVACTWFSHGGVLPA